MFKLKFKTNLIAIAILSICLLGFVSHSHAFEIEEMEPSYGGYEDHSGWLYHTARVETDEPYSDVWWYINGDYVGWTSSHVDDPKTIAYFSPSGPGSHNGTTYTIKAVAQSFMDENGNIDQDTASYDVVVYRTFHIESLIPFMNSYEYDWGDGASHQAYVKTSEPYSSIKGVDWYLNGVYQYTSLGNGVKTSAYCTFSNLIGTLKGTKHEITAKAWILEDGGEFFPATKTYTIRVYKPETDDANKLIDVSGLARLYRHYYDGEYIMIDCYIFACNETDEDLKASGKFRHTVEGFVPIVRNQPEEIMTANGGSYSKSDSLPQYVGTIGDDRTYKSDAYIRLIVKPVNWFVGNQETFDSFDNP